MEIDESADGGERFLQGSRQREVSPVGRRTVEVRRWCYCFELLLS